MKIAYILDRPELSGGVKVVFQHASLLLEQGAEVTIFAIGEVPNWVDYAGEYVDISIGPSPQGHFDLVIATYWTTISMAEKFQLGPIVHYCQGFEGSYPHLQSLWPVIRKAYQKPYPCFTVSTYLSSMLQDSFSKQCYLVTPSLDPLFVPEKNKTLSAPYKILLSGIFECNWKGVSTGLKVYEQLLNSGLKCELTRLSLIEFNPEEKEIAVADNYICAAAPEQVACLTRESDLVLFPSLVEEGFGLPLLEAMVSGVPVVSSDIPSARQITQNKIPLCNPDKPAEFAEQALTLLNNTEKWDERSVLGRELAIPYQRSHVSNTLIQAIEWAKAQYQ